MINVILIYIHPRFFFIKCIHISEPKTTIKKQFLTLLRVWVSLKIYNLQKYRFECLQVFQTWDYEISAKPPSEELC